MTLKLSPSTRCKSQEPGFQRPLRAIAAKYHGQSLGCSTAQHATNEHIGFTFKVRKAVASKWYKVWKHRPKRLDIDKKIWGVVEKTMHTARAVISASVVRKIEDYFESMQKHAAFDHFMGAHHTYHFKPRN